MINREIGIMIRCQHPTIIKFHGYSVTDFNGDENVTIIMEFAAKGSLFEFLESIKKCVSEEVIDNTTRQKILVGIARGMMYLHQHQIVHRDLKLGNILLDKNFHPHITDFGLSKIIDMNNTSYQSNQYGTSISLLIKSINKGFSISYDLLCLIINNKYWNDIDQLIESISNEIKQEIFNLMIFIKEIQNIIFIQNQQLINFFHI